METSWNKIGTNWIRIGTNWIKIGTLLDQNWNILDQNWNIKKNWNIGQTNDFFEIGRFGDETCRSGREISKFQINFQDLTQQFFIFLRFGIDVDGFFDDVGGRCRWIFR